MTGFVRVCDDCGVETAEAYVIDTRYSTLDAPVCESCLSSRGVDVDDDRVESV